MSSDDRWDDGPDDAGRDEAKPGKPKTFAEKWNAHKAAGAKPAKPHPFGWNAAAEFSQDPSQNPANLNGDDDEFLAYMMRFKDQGDRRFPGAV